jgi:ZIP family zinc transporter
MDVLALTAAATGTALATGIGALPVIMLGQAAERVRPFLAGLAVVVMGAASIGLLVPAAREGAPLAVAAGVAAGFVFVAAARRRLVHRRRLEAGRRSSLLVFAVLLVHSLPEGFAVGAAWASTSDGLGLFVVLAIAVQNIPEGTAIAIPMEAAGFSGRQQVSAAIASSAPQPIGALVAYALVEAVQTILPFSLAFAAGAMLTVVALELLPDLWKLRGRGVVFPQRDCGPAQQPEMPSESRLLAIRSKPSGGKK